MKTSTISALTVFLLVGFSCSWAAHAGPKEHFLLCLREIVPDCDSISSVVYTQKNASFQSILRDPIKNLRYASKSLPEPDVIITPRSEHQIPPIVFCAKESDLQIRTRSNGHDMEGLSYVAQEPFVIIDMLYLSEVHVDIETETAWIGAGATLGSIYYGIAQKSPVLGFPGGFCPSVGVGGYLSGGGYGWLLRKYGVAADHVIDARIVDVHGRILNRRAMGEDLFWAIRGGTGASFGVILAWKVTLVKVPRRLTAFNIQRTLEQNATELVHRWQYVAPNLDRNLFLMVHVGRQNYSVEGKVIVSFFSFYLGRTNRLLSIMRTTFPELGLRKEDCSEMSWVEAAVFAGALGGYNTGPIEILLNRTQPNVRYNKIKSDYVQTPIPSDGIDGIWRTHLESGGEKAEIVFTPYGGRMAEVPSTFIPFPHRAGYLYKLWYISFWEEPENQNADLYIGWMRKFFQYLTPYVSKNPRGAYVNYRDLDIGVNNVGRYTSYEQASVWGLKYFDHNFDRLVRVKTAVDPYNFFRNEQSIPSLLSQSPEEKEYVDVM